MFTFIPQLLIILSIVGIILILLGKVPKVYNLPFSSISKQLFFRTREVLKLAATKFWHYVLEAKELSKKGARLVHLPQSLKKLHFATPNLKFFRTAVPGRLEDFGTAEQRFIKLIEKDPHGEAAYVGLGKLYMTQNKPAEAIETYQYLTKRHPENDTYFASLGQAYQKKKFHDQAITAYEKAIELKPENPKWYVNLGLSLEAKSHVEEAILNYRRAHELERDNLEVLMVLSEALAKKGEKAEALACLEKVLVLDPTNEIAREKLMHLKF